MRDSAVTKSVCHEPSDLLFSPRMQAASRSSFQPVEAGAILAVLARACARPAAPRRLGCGLDRSRRARRRRRRHPRRGLRRLPPLQGLLLVMAGVFSTPRPAPGRRAPALAGAAVIVARSAGLPRRRLPDRRLGARGGPLGGRRGARPLARADPDRRGPPPRSPGWWRSPCRSAASASWSSSSP